VIDAVIGEVPRFLAGVEVASNSVIHRGWKTRCARRETKRRTRTNTSRLFAAMFFRRLAFMHRGYAGIAA